MLSYQHAYHAGSLTDVHKHACLLSLLEILGKRHPKLQYFETHAGRALYDLTGPEARKTREAEVGTLALQDIPPQDLARLSPTLARYGELSADPQRYPGSPALARAVLGKRAQLHLAELHPQEAKALAAWAKGDGRIQVHRQDGYAMVAERLTSAPSLVLIDPSYEIKSEYLLAAEHAVALAQEQPSCCLALWYPMLADGREAALEAAVKARAQASGQAALQVALRFPPLEHRQGFRGTQGSGLIILGSNLGLVRKPLSATVKAIASAFAGQRAMTAAVTWLVKPAPLG